MIGRDGNKTDIYEAGKAVNEELRSFEKVYKQFNSGWLGVCPVYGTNNTSADEFYFNKSMDALANPLELKRLSELKGFETDEDVIIGYMKDGSGNPGFMVVNYNGKREDGFRRLYAGAGLPQRQKNSSRFKRRRA